MKQIKQKKKVSQFMMINKDCIWIWNPPHSVLLSNWALAPLIFTWDMKKRRKGKIEGSVYRISTDFHKINLYDNYPCIGLGLHSLRNEYGSCHQTKWREHDEEKIKLMIKVNKNDLH